jgi:predicted AlkP superfamily pyrophosphatase or phosphodiesterase
MSFMPAAQAAPPRLVVIVVADQFRADYLTTFAAHWRAGFRTLLDEGAVYRRAAYPYLHTDTCAGHFTISTGTLPRTHGMIADNWWAPELRRQIECTDDDASPNVTYGRPAKLGKSGRNLLVPTLADELRAQKPGARVVSMSIKARGAIGLAGHGGDAVTWFEEGIGVGSFVTARAFSEHPVHAINEFIKLNAHEKDAGTIWTLRDPAAMYRYPDAGIGERPPVSWTGLFPHVIRGRGEGADDQFTATWRGSPLADAYLGRMAVAAIDAFALGQRDTTDFLGIGFSSTDIVGHAFGPESREVEDTVARLDDTLGAVIAHLDMKVGRANYVLALSADHGVAPVPVTRQAGRIASEDIRDRIEETLTMHLGRSDRGPYVVSNYVENMYLAPGVLERVRTQPAVMREVERSVAALPGIDRVVWSDQVTERATDRALRAAALGFMKSRTGDLIVTTKENWFLAGRNGTNATGHGTSFDYDQQVPLILLGAGIKAGRFDTAVTPADIAPTLARVAGLQMPKAEGRPLQDALR